jgi:NAD-dependent dihydropyrimidine dehydrogenase PreA subunit
MKRKIVRVDPELCDGCGLCVPSCAEGAIKIVNGKAVLSDDALCDGLGNCLGECPQGAITMEEREAATFDERQVETAHPHQHPTLPAGCPSSRPMDLSATTQPVGAQETTGTLRSRLGQWPIQLHLLPVTAPFYQDREMVVAADCVPFSFADFHRQYLAGSSLVIFCPKLDGANEEYTEKLAAIFAQNDVPRICAVIMEVPCCSGLLRVVQEAIKRSGKDIPLSVDVIGIRGDVKPKQ